MNTSTFPTQKPTKKCVWIFISHQQTFLRNPVRFTSSPSPLVTLPLISLSVCILGLPCSGKSTLAKQLGKGTGAVMLSMREVLQRVISSPSCVGEIIRQRLQRSENLTDEEYVLALKQIIESAECRMKG